MAKSATTVQVSIVHDQLGRIISVNRPAKGVKALVLCGNGQSAITADVHEGTLKNLIGTHRVDITRKSLVKI